jgi:hypothetical protein
MKIRNEGGASHRLGCGHSCRLASVVSERERVRARVLPRTHHSARATNCQQDRRATHGCDDSAYRCCRITNTDAVPRVQGVVNFSCRHRFKYARIRSGRMDGLDGFLNPITLGLIVAVVAAAALVANQDGLPQIGDKRKGPHSFQPRRQQQRGDYSKSQMADMLSTNDHLDPQSRHGKSFRPMYRIPASMFEDIYRWIDQNRERFGFQKQDHDCVGRRAVPLKLKLLACFFMLSTGLLPKGMAHQIGCDEETMRVCFLLFIRTISTELGAKWIQLPTTAEELAKHVSTYEEEGLPGCMGSIDCTHIGWCRARTSVKSWYCVKPSQHQFTCNYVQVHGRGRRSDCSISSVCSVSSCASDLLIVQVIVDHSTRVLAVSDIHPGSNSDEHISRLDAPLQLIRFGALFTSFVFNLLCAPGALCAHRAVYLISDGGYQAWRVFQMTFKFSSDDNLQRLYVP